MKRRTWSIRSRILTLLFAPLIPLLGMWIFSTSETLGPALNLLDAKTSADGAGLPASEIVDELQAERKLSVLFVSDKGADGKELSAQRAKTDEKIAKYRRLSSTDEVRDAANAQMLQHLALSNTALDSLVGGRAAIDRRQFDRVQVMSLFGGIVDRFFGLYGSIAGVDDQRLAQEAATVIALTEARELLTREDALLGGIIASGAMTVADQNRMTEHIGVQRYAYVRAGRYLTTADQLKYKQIVEGPAFKSLRTMEDRIVAGRAGAAVPIDPIQWRSDFSVVNTQLLDLEGVAANRTVDETIPTAIGILVRFGVAGGLGFVVVVVLIVIAIRNARSLIRRVSDLRDQALEVANTHLPRVVARLRGGEQVDVEAESPRIEHVADELGELGNAFAEVQRTAISSAVQEAALRSGLNQVFLNIARRNQTLLHRQLSLLDAMERRVTDPGDLEELFRIDHLAARMRRHAEDLVILAGAHPGRGWRNPVPMADVLRAAVSEVEEYTRVSVIGVPEIALAGRAVSDVVHLLAELLENATLFSPGDTGVKLSGQLVPNGFAVEIEDRGVGMPADRIEEANERLRQPPDFDPAHSSRLGLFVVAKLAARHGVTVTLRTSAYGGVTAVALIPPDVVVKSHSIEAGGGASAVIEGDEGAAVIVSETKELALVSALARVESGDIESGGVGTGSPDTRESDARVGPGSHRAEPRQIEAAPLTPEGLPLRQRQASLSPKLRHPATPLDGVVVPSGQAPAASPPAVDSEQMRMRLSRLQAGTIQGRRDAAAGSQAAADDQEEPS